MSRGFSFHSHSKLHMGMGLNNFNAYDLLNQISEKDLKFILKSIGWKNNNEIDERIRDTLRKVGLEEKANKMPYELSGGEQQRASIARAIVNNPSLIIADEPTGNLDYKTSSEIFSYFLKLKKIKKTIIFATHNRELANRADYKLSISNGGIKRVNVR